MPELLTAIDGTSFVLSDRSGNMNGGVHGLYVRDCRYLSRWELRLADTRPKQLSSHHVDFFSSLCFLANADAAPLPPNSISLIRRRVVGNGMEEDWEIVNHEHRTLTVPLSLAVGADFLDLFDVKAQEFAAIEDQVFTGDSERSPVRRRSGRNGSPALTLSRTDGAFQGRTEISTTPPPDQVQAGVLTWRLRLKAHETQRITLKVALKVQREPLMATHDLGDFGRGAIQLEARLNRRRSVSPQLKTPWWPLQETFRRSIADLGALLIEDADISPRLPAVGLPAAGLPWFMTLFGRDTLIASYQLLPSGLEMAWGALRALAELQATVEDPTRDAQPGRIVHELRRGPIAVNSGHFPYYGTIDAPLLFLVLLEEAYRWSGDERAVRALRAPAMAILDWIDACGDADGDGFIEYQRRAKNGLENQGWKDSWDSMRFHDGSIARAPIAASEVQGYAYDAYRRIARLARGPWKDPELAFQLEAKADRLYELFNRVFWSEERGGFYHLALDRDKRPVDSKTSNMGHLLWSGIVPRERAGAVVAQLMGPDLFSGWGIRTMSSEDRGYNPISYHCGTVWPHDNSIAVAGLHRYGFHAEANLVMEATIDAAAFFPGWRLPEAFAGYSREVGPFPVEYPTAGSPQAWAAAAPLLMLRAALGLEPDTEARTIIANPHLPGALRELELNGCPAFDRAFQVVVSGGRAQVRPVAAERLRIGPKPEPERRDPIRRAGRWSR
jgi:glycogen debranching enzyme